MIAAGGDLDEVDRVCPVEQGENGTVGRKDRAEMSQRRAGPVLAPQCCRRHVPLLKDAVTAGGEERRAVGRESDRFGLDPAREARQRPTGGRIPDVDKAAARRGQERAVGGKGEGGDGSLMPPAHGAESRGDTGRQRIAVAVDRGRLAGRRAGGQA